jgi:hypothetical protein
MLTCDFLMHVRASRTIAREQIVQIERALFGSGKPSRHQLDMLFLVDTYLRRREPGWAELMTRARHTALAQLTEEALEAEPLAKVA